MVNFDRHIDRRGTSCIKWDHSAVRNDETVLPMWVADMDFAAPDEVVDALKRRAAHGIYGYTHNEEDNKKLIASWCHRRYNLTVQEDWLLRSPGVIFTLRAALAALTDKGDAVLVHTPIYPPFLHIPAEMGRRVVQTPLLFGQDGFTMDYAAMEDAFSQGVKLLILCNPHNPTGRVWRREELERLASLCREYHVTVISDEIHCDLILPGNRFYSFLHFAGEDLLALTLFSCTKTFNLAGLHNSSAAVPEAKLRREIAEKLYAYAPEEADIFGMIAQRTAYESCEYWLDELRTYLDGNFDAALAILAGQSKLKAVKSQGTYLQLVDCRALGMDDKALEQFFIHTCKVLPSMGEAFAAPGYVRLNFAMPRADVMSAMERIVAAVKHL